MIRILIGAAITLWVPMLAFGQERTSSAQTSAPPTNSSVPAAGDIDSATRLSDGSGDKIVLKDGQAIVLRSTRRLSSETVKVGEAVPFEVIKTVAIGDLVIIPEHAVAIGRIVSSEEKKRRLRSGKLAVAIERVAIVTGQPAPLRSTEVRGERARDYSPSYGGAGAPGAEVGVLLVAPLIVLLAHGSETVIPVATRVTAYLDGDLVLDREAVQKAQAALPKPRTDVGTVYVYRERLKNDRDYPNNYTGTTCGEALLGLIHPGQFVSLQLPPGEYWLRAGVLVRIGTTVDKNILKGKRKQFLPLNVEEGHSYYLRVATRRRGHWLDSYSETYLEQVDQATGADTVFTAESWADFGLEDISPEMLLHLQAQPKAASDKGDQRSRD